MRAVLVVRAVAVSTVGGVGRVGTVVTVVRLARVVRVMQAALSSHHCLDFEQVPHFCAIRPAGVSGDLTRTHGTTYAFGTELAAEARVPKEHATNCGRIGYL